MLDEELSQEIALFRYGLIAPLINKDLKEGERYALAKELSNKTDYKIPNSKRTTVSLRSILRYLAAYEKDGFDGLKPKNRKDLGTIRSIPEDILKLAKNMRLEVPSRSVEKIIHMLELSGKAPKGMLRSRTLSDYFKKEGISRQDLREKTTGVYRKFQKSHRNSMWQGDTQTTLYLPDPNNPSRKKKVYLMAFLDDFSRISCHSEFGYADNRFLLECTLRKAILKRGKPNMIFVDNGAVYSSKYLEWICARLKIQLVHSRVGRPASRGKIERFFQHVDSSFRDEAYLLIDQGHITSLEQLNQFYEAWVETYYNQRVHSAIKKSPINAFEKDPHPLCMAGAEEIYQAFLWKEERTVDKTGCISLNANLYEVDPSLARQKVYLLYNPFDLKEIEVFKDNKSFGMAQPLSVTRDIHKDAQSAQESPVPSTGINYLTLLKQTYDDEKKQQLKLSFKSLQEMLQQKEEN